MKKRISFSISILLLEISAIFSILAGTIGFKNEKNTIGDYITSLLKNPYESLIVKSDGNLEDSFNNDEYSKPIETRIGLYSEDIEASIFGTDSVISLIKSSRYEFDQFYNDFGVLSSYVGGRQLTWKDLNENTCFISRQHALKLASDNNISEEEVLNKDIIIGDKIITISGIYYTNTNSQENKELKTHGNNFSLTFENCIFVSNDFNDPNIFFKSFLYLQTTTKVNNTNMFFEFWNASKEKGFSLKINDDIGTYHLDNDITYKIESLETYYSMSKTAFSIIMILVALISLIFSIFALIKSRIFVYLKPKFVNVLLLLVLFTLVINLVLAKFLYFSTSRGAKVSFTNPSSILIISFVYLVFMCFYIIKMQKTKRPAEPSQITNEIVDYIVIDI